MNTATILTKISIAYAWITNVKLELEHYGMGAVILISTWHVSQHMESVEGSTIVAVVMGMVLGFMNATFALRFFEDRSEVRWPAGVGILFSAAVSIWMQYGFYNEQSDLSPYMAGFVNINALVFGAWAPAFEILLGWLYGVRLHIRTSATSVIDKVKSEMQKKIDELTAQKGAQLSSEQALRDQLHQAKIDHAQLINEDAILIDAKDAIIVKLREEIDQLKEEITALRVSNAEMKGRSTAQQLSSQQLASMGAQLSSKLSSEQRKDKIVKIVTIEPNISKSELAKRLGVARNTIAADLTDLEAAGTVSVNGSIHVLK